MWRTESSLIVLHLTLPAVSSLNPELPATISLPSQLALGIPRLHLPSTGIVKTFIQHLRDFWRPSIDCLKQHKLILSYRLFFPLPLSVCLSILMMLDMNTC